MGMRTPLYPYFAASGKGRARTDWNNGHYNSINRRIVADFKSFMDRPATRAAAFNFFDSDTVNDASGWFRAETFEEDLDRRPKLSSLLDLVGVHGAIVVPDVSHIEGRKDDGPPSGRVVRMMSRIIDENIQIISVKSAEHDLSELLQTHGAEAEMFLRVPLNAMSITFHLMRSRDGRVRKN